MAVMLLERKLGGFHKREYPKNGWFIRGHPIKVDDLGVAPFMEPPMRHINTASGEVNFKVAMYAWILEPK